MCCSNDRNTGTGRTGRLGRAGSRVSVLEPTGAIRVSRVSRFFQLFQFFPILPFFFASSRLRVTPWSEAWPRWIVLRIPTIWVRKFTSSSWSPLIWSKTQVCRANFASPIAVSNAHVHGVRLGQAASQPYPSSPVKSTRRLSRPLEPDSVFINRRFRLPITRSV